jgi:hypothetical protein
LVRRLLEAGGAAFYHYIRWACAMRIPRFTRLDRSTARHDRCLIGCSNRRTARRRASGSWRAKSKASRFSNRLALSRGGRGCFRTAKFALRIAAGRRRLVIGRLDDGAISVRNGGATSLSARRDCAPGQGGCQRGPIGGLGRGAPRSTARGYRWVPGECWCKSEGRALALVPGPKGGQL